MKKQLLLLISMLLPMVVQGYDFQIDGIYYRIFNSENNTLEVTYSYPNEKNSDSYSGDIVVPEEVIYNDIKYTVVGIGQYAFNFCNKVTSVVLPQSIVNLSSYAFENCSSLNSINIPESVSYIGTKSFSGCKNLTSINGGSGVLGIQDCAFQNCSALTNNNMFPNLTGIGVGAFKGCTGLTSIIIPKSVRNIKDNPFPDCPNITSITVEDANEYYDSRNDCDAIIDKSNNTLLSGCMNTVIPEDVVKIGNDAFWGCTGLTSITLPESVSSIGNCAFQSCSGLTSITIPNSVTYIGGSVFRECSSLSSIKVEQDNTRYDSRNDCNAIIEKKSNTLLSGCMNTVIPKDVVKIGNCAFSGSCGLTSLDIPNSITSIESNAFEGCTGLPSLYISMNVSYIAETAFEGCTGISSIIVDPNNSIYDSRDNCNAIVKGDKLILACDNTVIPLNVTSFSWYAFCNCRTVEIPDGIESMPSEMFRNCPQLKLIKIPKSVKSIETSSIDGCKNLKTIVFEDGEDELKFYNSYISEPEWIIGCSLDSLYIGRNINFEFTKSNQTYDQYSPFRNNETLRTVSFGNKVTIIPNSVFRNCSNLISVNTPETMDSIGNWCFYECEKLSSFVIPYGIRTIGYSTFQGCKSLKTINIPETVTHIKDNAFDGCEGLQKIDIPSSVMRIEGRAFGACKNLSDLKFRDGNASLVIREAGYSSAFYGCPITSIYLGRNIINNSYNYIYSSLGSITTPFNLTISKFVTELRGGTFAQCEKILSITFKEGADTLTLIKDYNAYNSIMPFVQTPIDSIYLGRVIVGKDAYYPDRTIIPFSNVGSSFVMQIGKNFTEIGDQSYNSWNISSVTIPNNVQRIGFAAFGNCSSLKYLIIDDGENNLDFGIGDKNYSCFYGCSIDSLYLGRNLTYSQYSPFRKNTGISSLVLGNSVTEIGEALFVGFKSLLSIDLPKNLTKIGKQAFYGCEGLTALTIPNSVREIGQQAFDLCRGLKTLTFEDGEEDLAFTAEQNFNNNAFSNSPLEIIYLGRDIVYANVSPFFGIESIKELTLGNKVTRLSDGAFGACPNLKVVYSDAETVPTTEGYVFTESYLADATLFVPYSLYDEYRVTYPWNKFGNMINDEGKYNLFYVVDGDEYKKYVVNEGDSIIPETEPTKEGYTFSGWSEIPETMTAHDVTVTGSFSINSYKLTYMLDDKVYKEVMCVCGATITPEPQPEGVYDTFEWIGQPETMPAHDVVVYAMYTSEITDVLYDAQQNVRIYTPNGKKLNKLQKGLNIVVQSDGTVKKVVVK